MYREQWERILAVWRDKLQVSLDLSQALRIHLVAEENGKGEMHRFMEIDDDRPSAEFVVRRMIRQLIDLKLADQDPAKMQLRAVGWVNRQTALDEFGRIPQEGGRPGPLAHLLQ